MKTLHIEIPERQYHETKLLVEKGWFRNEQELFLEALRRYLEAHSPELMEQFIREDVEWGLHGDE